MGLIDIFNQFENIFVIEIENYRKSNINDELMRVMLNVTKYDVIIFVSRCPMNNDFQDVITYMEILCFDNINFELCSLILKYCQDIKDKWTGEIYS